MNRSKKSPFVPVKAADPHKYKAQFSMIHQNNERQLDFRRQRSFLELSVLLSRDVKIDRTEYRQEARFQTMLSIEFVLFFDLFHHWINKMFVPSNER